MDEPLEVGGQLPWVVDWDNGWIWKVGQWVNNHGEDGSCTKSFKKKMHNGWTQGSETMDELLVIESQKSLDNGWKWD